MTITEADIARVAADAATNPASTDTHCPYCALQCAMTLTAPDATERPGMPATSAAPTAGDRAALPLVVSGRAFPTNRGGLCKKGWTSAELLMSRERIAEPMARQSDGTFAAVGWEAALDRIADTLRSTRQSHGADAVGVFGGGGLTSNSRGTVHCRASVTPDIRQDTAFLPFHFPAEQRANLLTSDATDPISGMPEFKTAAVYVRPLAVEVPA